ncbi:MAG: hypothetical protein JKY95_17935 [Planctomycetaceae bacterium]|nr:hypothetical protein [Planctomycetaceae bacterium]
MSDTVNIFSNSIIEFFFIFAAFWWLSNLAKDKLEGRTHVYVIRIIGFVLAAGFVRAANAGLFNANAVFGFIFIFAAFWWFSNERELEGEGSTHVYVIRIIGFVLAAFFGFSVQTGWLISNYN